MGILPLLLCSALLMFDDDRVGSSRQGSLLVCPPVSTEIHDDVSLLLVHDHPSDVAIRILVRASSGRYERLEPLSGDTARQFDLLDLLAPLGASQGHIFILVCDLEGQPIAHNQISASVRLQSASDVTELPVAVFRALSGSTGEVLPTPEHVSLDGVEYGLPGNRHVLDFFAVGAMPVMGLPVDTKLGVVPLDLDFSDRNTVGTATQLRFEIWNENEVKFSGTSHCFDGMGWVGLEDLNGSTNHFRRLFLGTDSGKARLDTFANTSCAANVTAPALVAWVFSDFGSGQQSGRMLRATGRQSAALHIPVSSAPEESGATVDISNSNVDGLQKITVPIPNR